MTLLRRATLAVAAALATGGLMLSSASAAPAAPVEEPPIDETTTSQDVEASVVYKNVWRNAPSHYSSYFKTPTGGTLNAGSNYFYCQSKGRTHSAHGYTNHWWLKTDDDSGFSNVWVSAVYISGGNNNEPIAGVPHCTV